MLGWRQERYSGASDEEGADAEQEGAQAKCKKSGSGGGFEWVGVLESSVVVVQTPAKLPPV